MSGINPSPYIYIVGIAKKIPQKSLKSIITFRDFCGSGMWNFHSIVGTKYLKNNGSQGDLRFLIGQKCRESQRYTSLLVQQTEIGR